MVSVTKIYIAGLLSVIFCQSVDASQLTVAVAANVKFVFDELKIEFKKESGIDVNGVFASSGKINAQIVSGAPYDVFMSADMVFPETLHRDGLAVTKPKIYARGVLVLWTLKPLDLSEGMNILTSPSVTKVAIANPRLAPYGSEAMHALENIKLRASVEPKLIYGESIGQVNQYIDTQSADIGFTAKSTVLSPQMQGHGKWIDVPIESYQPIEQGIVMLKLGAERNLESSRRFMEFIMSVKARRIFENFGYILP